VKRFSNSNPMLELKVELHVSSNFDFMLEGNVELCSTSIPCWNGTWNCVQPLFHAGMERGAVFRLNSIACLVSSSSCSG